jgi:hypothetical protein
MNKVGKWTVIRKQGIHLLMTLLRDARKLCSASTLFECLLPTTSDALW